MTDGIYNHVDSRFDRVQLAGIEPNKRAVIQQSPHCDCHASNEAFYRKKIKRHRDPQHAYDMVPVVTESDGSCEFCHYQTALLAVRNVEEVRARGKRNIRGTHFEVVGVCLSTGKEIRFESIRAAQRAGFLSIQPHLDKGTSIYGWTWRRAV